MKETLIDVWYYYFVGGWDMFQAYVNLYRRAIVIFLERHGLLILILAIIYVWAVTILLPMIVRDFKSFKNINK